MTRYLYLSLIPESLIVSQLAPEEFGSYFATGSRKRSRGQAIFFALDPGWDGAGFNMAAADERCVAHPDGSPRRSVYAGIYRVLERVPLTALRTLYLITGDGRALALESAPIPETSPMEHHLYQELCPITPRVVSDLSPQDFVRYLTNETNPVYVHTIVFCELALDRLARDPDSEHVGDLPYRNIGHLRDCLKELENKPAKQTKTVHRSMSGEVLYRTVKNGFFVGNATGIRYFPLPSREQLEREYYEWWRSAQNAFGE